MNDSETKPTFEVQWEEGPVHIAGDPDCTGGWCDGGNGRYPKPCECGGLIHADWGDENWDGDYWLWTKCDVCGESE